MNITSNLEEITLRKLVLSITTILILSIALVIITHAVNSYFLLGLVRARLSGKELLFIEGLLSLILGGIFFLPELRNPVIGAKQHLLLGAPSVGPKSKLSKGTIQLALALILTGFVLLLLFLAK